MFLFLMNLNLSVIIKKKRIESPYNIPVNLISVDRETKIPIEKRGVKSKGFFSRFKKEKNSEQKELKRKWAVESYHPSQKPKKEESKRLELGDLIKK